MALMALVSARKVLAVFKIYLVLSVSLLDAVRVSRARETYETHLVRWGRRSAGLQGTQEAPIAVADSSSASCIKIQQSFLQQALNLESFVQKRTIGAGSERPTMKKKAYAGSALKLYKLAATMQAANRRQCSLPREEAVGALLNVANMTSGSNSCFSKAKQMLTEAETAGELETAAKVNTALAMMMSTAPDCSPDERWSTEVPSTHLQQDIAGLELLGNLSAGELEMEMQAEDDQDLAASAALVQLGQLSKSSSSIVGEAVVIGPIAFLLTVAICFVAATVGFLVVGAILCALGKVLQMLVGIFKKPKESKEFTFGGCWRWWVNAVGADGRDKKGPVVLLATCAMPIVSGWLGFMPDAIVAPHIDLR